MNIKSVKRYLVCLLTAALLLTSFAPSTMAANTYYIYFEDSDGNPVDVDSLTVTVSNKSVSTSWSEKGKYSFTGNNNITATIFAEKSGYDDVTVQKNFKGNSSSVTITLTPTVPEEDQWYTFDLYYFIGTATNPFPADGYAAAGQAVNYGPSGDDSPFARINVNITKLKTYTDVVTYEEGANGNQWHFIPKTEKDVAATDAFWAAVLECCDDASIQALQATGLYSYFAGYCLKNQNANGDYHIDGILEEEPPVYVVELHKDKEYVGGTINGKEGPFHTMAEVLALLEGYLGHNITWNEDENGTPILTDGAYTGTYIIHGDGVSTVYDIDVIQTIGGAAGDTSPGTSDIKYKKQNDYYYLASFTIETDISHHLVTYTVTYTDGVENEEVFYDHEFGFGSEETVPTFPHLPHRSGYDFVGWQLRSDGKVYSDAQIAAMTATSDLIFDAQWTPFRVTFHANNSQANGGEDIFRVYYPEGVGLPDFEPAYHLNADGTVPVFYTLPEFSYEVHNDYIFKGWYTADGTAMDWQTVHDADIHLYAHWFTTGQVAQEDDGKVLSGNGYAGYDLAGLQIRTSENDPLDHNGTAGGGLRFITVLSEDLYSQINALAGNEAGAEYGFVMAKATVVETHSTGEDYRLEYKGSNVNGMDTSTDYSYAINLKCSGYTDHFNGQAYRLYTGVVTYKAASSQGEEALAAAHASHMVARSYIRYFDANGLYRTYYNNYTGNSRVAGGCSASYDTVLNLLQGE